MVIIRLFLLLLVCSALVAQTMVLTPSCTLPTTCTSSTITEYMKAKTAGGSTFVLRPMKSLITISNSGGGTLSWTSALGGTLSTACTNNDNACFRLTGQYNGTVVTSGGSQIVALNWNDHTAEQLAVGVYTGTITFTPNVGSPQVVTVTLNVMAVTTTRETNTPFPGYPVGCSASSYGNSYSDNCAISNNGTLAVPAVCSVQTDANFGAQYKRITVSGRSTEYGGTTPFSANGTYILTVDTSIGVLYIYRVSDCSLVAGSGGTFPGNATTLFMSHTDDQVYYYLNGATVHEYNFITQTDTTLGNYAGGIYGFTTIYTGGSLGATRDNWIVFTDYTFPATGSDLLCAVNLPQLKLDGSPGTGNTYCRDIQADGLGAIDLMGVWDMDTVVSKRFVYVGTFAVAAGIFSVGSPGALNLETLGPDSPGYNGNNDQSPCTTSDIACLRDLHGVLMRDRAGNAQLFAAFDGVAYNENYMSFIKVSSGYSMLRPIEEGGGLRFSQRKFVGALGIDMQPGSCDNGAVLAAMYGQTGIHDLGTANTVWAARVSAITAANPAVSTVSNPLPIGTQAVLIANAAGGTFGTCANGLVTAAVVTDATHITLTGKNCVGAGTYTANSATAGDAADTTFTSSIMNQSQVVVIIPGLAVRQLMMHRSIGWNNGITGTTLVDYYNATPKGSLSPDCTMGAFNSNWGGLNDSGTAVYVVYTGLSDIGTSPGSVRRSNSVRRSGSIRR